MHRLHAAGGQLCSAALRVYACDAHGASPGPSLRLPKVAEAALGALGMLTIARPSIMVDKVSPAKKIMKAALQPSAPELLKLKALSNLIELLRADEASMQSAQAEGGEGADGSAALPPSRAGGAGAKRRGGRKAAAAVAAAAAAGEDRVLQTQNGEGDTLSQSSSILQVGAWQKGITAKGCLQTFGLHLRSRSAR